MKCNNLATHPEQWLVKLTAVPLGPGLNLGEGMDPPRFPDLNPLNFFFCGHRHWFVYKTSLATVEDFTARIVIASTEIASTPELFECVQQSILRQCVGCPMILAAAT
ncbi:hypothetical protein TNCV_735721 [Trichonephila clavipes]|uniref:Uncharacterized protein n=1 Tax=Trichonephila clavipes TaxID=2585209 RepID=A0A8X6SSD1_TRICX|nr:hypothetical protein TNCV_735721 [Trichonephila clavipes]